MFVKAIEFETELTGNQTLRMPPEAASALPAKGKATVIVCVDMDPDEADWRKASYERFLSDDSPEDAVYDKYR